MTFVSYAQNFEDVLLWRALGHVQGGYYIDVGAAHPDTDSVTRAFYDRGWHGINIEPLVADCRRLMASRPRDITLGVAIAAQAGVADFFAVDGTGLSSLHRAEASVGERHGFSVNRLSVSVETLAAVCARHVASDIHFLKIDVEGAEQEVLEGADFTRWRPWIVLVEATAPMSTVLTHMAWEPILIDAGYRFVWFDGLNRFYVAAEHWAALSPHFQTPPNVFDNFLRVADTEWARRISQAETARDHFAAQAGAAEIRGAGLAHALTEERIARERTQFSAETVTRDAERRVAQHEDRARRMEERAHAAEHWLRSMHGSTSWKVTVPLRSAGRIAARLRGSAPAEAARLPSASPPPISVSPAPASPARRRRGSHVVHQFHSGSAVGDAITNSMLLIQRMLRAMGYVSDIFVEHCDPGLGAEIRTIDELPAHDDYVLLLHHSMGYDAFDRILALPAPKVLLYHNITPPEFLAGLPTTQHYAVLGRAQLARLSGVAAALGASGFNTIELSRAGFVAPAACTMLFDIAKLRQLAGAREPSSIFTVLFVGRISPSKAQLDLVVAFGLFRAIFQGSCRLVLVGRHGGPGDPYRDEIAAYLRDHDLTEAVTLTGLIDDMALRAHYDAADLYVSLSHHEGFGVPLVEAMAHGVPVLAWPSGAVPYTLDTAGELVRDRAPASVAAQMAALADDRPRRAAMVERQKKSLDRFDLDRQGETLVRALIQAGAAPPRSLALRGELAANLRFAVTGHFSGSYSLASVNRSLALALDQVRPGSVRVLPVEGEPTRHLSGLQPAAHEAISALLARPPPPTGPEVTISQHYPVHVPPMRGDAALAWFFWEESLVPRETVAVINGGFDAVLAASRFSAKALRDSGVWLPVAVIGHAPDLSPYRHLAGSRDSAADFTFLHVSSAFPRKGIDVLLAAYAASFRRCDKVRLVIKSFPNPHNDVAAQIAALRAGDADAPEIVLIDRDLDEAELLALFASANAMVLPTRGEGFNLPAAEAMAAGIPLIVTGFGGHMDFCGPDTVRLVSFRFAPSRSHLATSGSVWAEPDVDDLALAMREAVAGPPASRTKRAAAAVVEILTAGSVVRRVSDAAIDAIMAAPSPPLRMAWITSWDVRCGIAEYARYLRDAMQQDAGLGGITILADERVGTTTDRAVAAWRLGDPASVLSLARGILRDNPDVVVVQHQPGLLSWATLAGLLEHPVLRALVVAVTLHNTRDLLDQADDRRAWVVAALRGAGRVIVHTVADLNLLNALGLNDNVVMIPHGVPTSGPPVASRVLVPAEPVVIGCYGFFLSGKGIRQLIDAVAILRRMWPGVRLRLINADYGNDESRDEISACRAAAEQAGIADAVDWHTEFLPINDSVALLAGCDLVVLPYQTSKEASSAALRTALSAGVCVAVTPLPLFEEADDAVMRFAGIDAPALAAGIAALLDDVERRTEIQAQASRWCQARAWPVVATRTLGMLRGLTHDRAYGRAHDRAASAVP